MRFRPLVAALALLAGLLPTAGAAAPAPAPLCADINVPLRNFKVEAKWVKSAVKVGDTARLQVLVTRTAEEDPVTEDGEPYPTGRPMEEPVEDVVLGLSMLVGDIFLAGSGVTNADGKAEVKLKIKSYTKPGTGNSRLYAEKRLTPPNFPASSCRLTVYEYGTLDPVAKLKVVR